MTELLPAAPATTAGAAPRRYTIALPARLPLLNSNQRPHYQRRAEITRTLRNAATLACRTDPLLYKALITAGDEPVLHGAHIIGVLHPDRRIRRDPANLYPSFKAAVDGLVDAGVLEDDDSTRVLGPDMRLGEVVRGGQIVLHVHEIRPDVDGWPVYKAVKP